MSQARTLPLTVVLPVSDNLEIRSHSGPYRVRFVNDVSGALRKTDGNVHYLIDTRVAELHKTRLEHVLGSASVLLIETSEDAKTLERLPTYVQHLTDHEVRRNHRLVAIGGGVVQDITAFLAATLLRGVDWSFVPTTLLAQADSCIGSKSSINAAGTKNLLGTFHPPREILLDVRFVETLDAVDVRSGIGEMLKVHAIEGRAAFDEIAEAYDRLLSEPDTLQRYVRRSLEIKRHYIEEDEFDRGIRNVFNYGHSFGHALEAATDYAVPHGVAVTLGMDMANWSAMKLDLINASHYHRMRGVLRKNYAGFEHTPVPADRFLAALARDKKNVGNDLVLILPQGDEARIDKYRVANDDRFTTLCEEFLNEQRTFA